MAKLALNRTTLRQAFRFCVVGGLNTAVDYGSFWLLTRIPFFSRAYLLSQGISYTLGILNSLLLNKVWTFQDKRRLTAGTAARFVAVCLAALLVSFAVMAAGKHALSIESNMVLKLIALPFTLGLGFIGNKLFVFRES